MAAAAALAARAVLVEEGLARAGMEVGVAVEEVAVLDVLMYAHVCTSDGR